MDARLRPDFRPQRARAGLASPTGASTAGPSTTTGISTTSCPAAWQKLLGLPAWQPRPKPERREAAWCSRADRSTSTARASAHHRGMPAERGAAAQSGREPRAAGARILTTFSASTRSSGWAAALRATTPTATWTTLRASSGRRRLLPPSSPTRSDPNHAPLAENLARLKAARTLDGKQFTIVELPMPRPVVFRGQRLPASYANFYIANGLVLVPTFHDPNDRVALNIAGRGFSRPRSDRHPLRRPDLGPGHAALHDPAAAGRTRRR